MKYVINLLPSNFSRQLDEVAAVRLASVSLLLIANHQGKLHERLAFLALFLGNRLIGSCFVLLFFFYLQVEI